MTKPLNGVADNAFCADFQVTALRYHLRHLASPNLSVDRPLFFGENMQNALLDGDLYDLAHEDEEVVTSPDFDPSLLVDTGFTGGATREVKACNRSPFLVAFNPSSSATTA